MKLWCVLAALFVLLSSCLAADLPNVDSWWLEEAERQVMTKADEYNCVLETCLNAVKFSIAMGFDDICFDEVIYESTRLTTALKKLEDAKDILSRMRLQLTRGEKIRPEDIALLSRLGVNPVADANED